MGRESDGGRGRWAAAASAGLALAFLALLPACTSRPRSDSAESWRRRGAAAEDANHPDSALTTYREAARRYPTEAWPWAGVGRASEALGRFEDAEEALRTAVRWDSTCVPERVLLARLALEGGRPEDALRWLDEAAAHRGEDGPRLALRARALDAIGRHGEASAALERAQAIAPADAAVLAAVAFSKVSADSASDALALLDDAITRHPDVPELHEDRARVLLFDADTTAAMAELERALELDARRPRARRTLADLLVRLGRCDDAEPHLRRLLEDDPLDVIALNAWSACALARGDREAAESTLRRAIASDPEFAPAYLSLGLLEADAGRRDEAVALVRKARARASATPRLWTRCSVALAELYLGLDEPANALEVADAMLERDEGSPEGRELRARALADGGAGPASGDELERMTLDPSVTPAELRAWSHWLVDHGNPERALATLDTLVAAHPDDADARLLRAEALLEAGRPEPARWALTTLVDEGNAPPAAYRLLARRLLAEGRPEEAHQRAAEGEVRAPQDPEMAHLCGEAARAAGDPQAARAAFVRERDLDPQRPDAWLALGILELESGSAEAAVPYLEQARDLDPADWRAWYRLAQAEEGRGLPVRAIEACREAVSRKEDEAAPHLLLGRLLADAGGPREEVAAQARRALELAPNDPEARELLRRSRP